MIDDDVLDCLKRAFAFAYHVRFFHFHYCHLAFFFSSLFFLLYSTSPRVKPGKFSLQECLRYGSFLSYIFGQLGLPTWLSIYLVVVSSCSRVASVGRL